jgi:subtilisin family serine protease
MTSRRCRLVPSFQLFSESLEQRTMLSATADTYGSRLATLSWQGRDVEVVQDSWLVRMPQTNAATASTVVDYQTLRPTVPDGWNARPIGLGMYDITAPGGSLATVSRWAQHQGTLWIQPNFFSRRQAVFPNEGPIDPPTNPGFDNLWGLHNIEQFGDLDNEPRLPAVPPAQGNGTLDADIDAPEAWEITTGSRQIIIAVLDDGIDYTHPDLSDNMWLRPANVPASEYGLHGWDSADDDGDIRSAVVTDAHGTHVAGTIGATGDNDIGITGVAWDVQLYGAKVFGDGAVGASNADIAAGISKIVALRERYGQNIVAINASLGGYDDSLAVLDAIAAANAAGILLVAAAGNGLDPIRRDGIGDDNDVLPVFPANYSLPNVISVAASNRLDQLTVFSNFGRTSVDIAAPGSGIWSTVPEGRYLEQPGTSMAAPHVTGVAALIASAFLDEYGRLPTVTEMKTAILDGADRIPGLTNNTTGGRVTENRRLNAHQAILQGISPKVSIRPASIAEGDIGNVFAEVVVTLSNAPQRRSVSVSYAALDGSARVAGDDYAATSGTLTFLPGESQKTIRIAIIGDRLIEAEEYFFVQLSNVVNAIGKDLTTVVTIRNDDFPPSLFVEDTDVVEGDNGVTVATFNVGITVPLPYSVTIRYATLERTAKPRLGDYQSASGSLTIPPGETMAKVRVLITGDDRHEADETFALRLLAPRGVRVARSMAFCTIINDDAVPVPTVALTDVQLVEGNGRVKMMNFSVTLASPSPIPVTVGYRTVDGTAVAGNDYLATAGTVSFSPGTTRRSITVWVMGDILAESNEQFFMELFEPSGVTLGRSRVAGTILDDDSQLQPARRSTAAVFAAVAAQETNGRTTTRRR